MDTQLKRARLLVPLIVFLVLMLAFVVGLLSQLPGLTLSYLCLIPFAGIWLGRASVGLHGYHIKVERS